MSYIMFPYSIELSRALRILTYRYPVYLLILIVGFYYKEEF